MSNIYLAIIIAFFLYITKRHLVSLLKYILNSFIINSSSSIIKHFQLAQEYLARNIKVVAPYVRPYQMAGMAFLLFCSISIWYLNFWLLAVAFKTGLFRPVEIFSIYVLSENSVSLVFIITKIAFGFLLFELVGISDFSSWSKLSKKAKLSILFSIASIFLIQTFIEARLAVGAHTILLGLKDEPINQIARFTGKLPRDIVPILYFFSGLLSIAGALPLKDAIRFIYWLFFGAIWTLCEITKFLLSFVKNLISVVINFIELLLTFITWPLELISSTMLLFLIKLRLINPKSF